MNFQPSPLPLPTRLVGGENVRSYSYRHATYNGYLPMKLESALRSRKLFPKTKSPRDPEYLAAWRALGKLHPRAFSEPEFIAGNWVATRALCGRCAGPSVARGRRPDIGWVCLKHKLWTGDAQVDVRRLPEVLVAERHWRGCLTPRAVLVDTPVVLMAEECARVSISKGACAERAERAPDAEMSTLIYPETVRFARLLTRPAFLAVMLGDETAPAKRRRVESEVAAICPSVPDAEPWRAVARVWDMMLDLAEVVRAAELRGIEPVDSKWNILRYRPVPPSG